MSVKNISVDLSENDVLAVRDPIHGWIKFSVKERALIDTPLMQRLRHIRQLTTVDLVYPGGTNSRFEHSLGAMHLAGMYAQSVFSWMHEDNEFLVTLTRVAALMHDIGHGPYSHSFDTAVYRKMYSQVRPIGFKTDGHDLHRHYIIDKDPFIVKALCDLGIEPWEISAIWNGCVDPINDPEKTHILQDYAVILSALVQGPLGADRMDFTMRDSHYTGTTHLGTIAHTRIIDHARVVWQNEKYHLVYSEKVVGDIIHALNGRQYMYNNVYLHKTCIAGSILIEAIIENWANLTDLDSRVINLDQFVYMTDAIIYEPLTADQICNYEEYPDLYAVLTATKAMIHRYLIRDLPKMVLEIKIKESDEEPTAITQYRSKSGYVINITRFIAGVDPDAFDKFGIKFGPNLVDCKTILAECDYSVPQAPYKLARVYKL